MALTPTIQIPSSQVLVTYNSISSGIKTPGASVLATVNFPTPDINASAANTLAAASHSSPMEMSSAAVLVAAGGRVSNFNMRAWTYSMDGHDFYVLQTGESGTLVYDLTTQQWMTWSSDNRDVPNWRAQTGSNWNSVSNNDNHSDVIAGDDAAGMLWYLDPTQNYDGSGYQVVGDTPQTFTRVLTGGIPMRGRETNICNMVFLTGSLGEPYPGSSVLLSTSDDMGKTWQDNNYITVNINDWTQDITWFSLGSFGAPGRIFKITDNGAFERIDSLDMK